MIYQFASKLAEELYGGELKRETPMSSGIDLRYTGEEPLEMNAGDMVMVGLGVRISSLDHALIFPRSSLFKRHGVILGNSVGVIDPDYTGELKAMLYKPHVNGMGKTTISPGERILQLVIFHALRTEPAKGVIEETERGDGGFGSTGAF